MLRVLFFARVREALDCASLEIAFSPQVARLDDLQEHLCQRGGEGWRAVLEEENMIRAINQVVAEGNQPLVDGDEVAFYPPVTGG